MSGSTRVTLLSNCTWPTGWPTAVILASSSCVRLPLDTTIPAEYVPDRVMRLGLYRRLADVATLDEIDSLAEEFNDRFGPLPESVSNLLFQVRIKILAVDAGLTSISIEGNQMILRVPEGVVPEEGISFPPQVRVGKSAYWVRFDPDSLDWPAFLVDLLESLSTVPAQ